MSAQCPDTIIINKEVHTIYDLPLEQYWKQNNNKPCLFSFKSSLNSGYYAKWLIENDKLFLVEFYGEYSLRPPVKTYSLSDLFPFEEKVFAEWYTGDITIPMGKVVDYVHFGWGSIYEYTTIIKITNGLVVDSGSFVIE